MNSTTVLNPLEVPLWGSALIEASAGTGKTWTIAALYLRLILGHGSETVSRRPLQPQEILIMTFTRAATMELSDRIRTRLLEAAQCFRQEKTPDSADIFLSRLLADYPDTTVRKVAAYRLAMAAEAMDEAAVFTIDAWCQRMLREHAFDSGSLFDEELEPDEQAIRDDAIRDYWREQVYPLQGEALEVFLGICPNIGALTTLVTPLLQRDHAWVQQASIPLAARLTQAAQDRQQQLAGIKTGWENKAQALQDWFTQMRADPQKPLDGRKTQERHIAVWIAGLVNWSLDAQAHYPDISDSAWTRLCPEGLRDACKNNPDIPLPPESQELEHLKSALDVLPGLRQPIAEHAGDWVQKRLHHLKRQAGTFGFADQLQRLDQALHGRNGDQLRARILQQYPAVLIDEFQDTSPIQYRIFSKLYAPVQNDPETLLMFIGDPKQSIYGFRGADIESYLRAREATAGRHYALSTNYRSTTDLVSAVNQIFLQAEGTGSASGYPQGAFQYRKEGQNPLPFIPVTAKGRTEALVQDSGPIAAMTLWVSESSLNNDGYRQLFAERCAEEIVTLLNDPKAGFQAKDTSDKIPLRPADIAILVRTGTEAEVVRQALQKRGVASVYLSDKESVFHSAEAQDFWRWMVAVANPLDLRAARAAVATPVIGLSLAELDTLARDDRAWEARVEQLKALHSVWQRQGILALLRRTLQDFDLPARLLAQARGERILTNLLHLGELLQSASAQAEGEQALIRWLGEHLAEAYAQSEDQVVRLESDADLVQVITIHKSKGLEYPLVFLPFACSHRPITAKNQSFYAYIDSSGQACIDFDKTEAARERADAARLQEDLRLLYVATTRARHALWLGISALHSRSESNQTLQHSAMGYLLAGGAHIGPERLRERIAAVSAGLPQIPIESVAEPIAQTLLKRREISPKLEDAPVYQGSFDRSWGIASFSSVVRDIEPDIPSIPQHLSQKDVLFDPIDDTVAATEDAPWHRFPRGALPGNFLHEQLQWLGNEGFHLVHRDSFAVQLAQRCKSQGWEHRQEDTIDWLREVAITPLPPLQAALTDIPQVLAEMEFWFPAERLPTRYLDDLCQIHVLPGKPRPALPERNLHGMLRGFMDLVFEHEQRYWVLDYKSNALGSRDADYTQEAFEDAVLSHRYDVQSTLYQLALHRLLRHRLGSRYDPEQHLGGTIFLFLRGIQGPERGCLSVPAQWDLVKTLDTALQEETPL